MTLDPAPGSAPGLVVCVGLPSDQIIEIAHLLRGRATVLATPDAEGARAVFANQAAPRGGPRAPRGLGVQPERFDNPGRPEEQTYGRHLPEHPPTGSPRATTSPEAPRSPPPSAGRQRCSPVPSSPGVPDGGAADRSGRFRPPSGRDAGTARAARGRSPHRVRRRGPGTRTAPARAVTAGPRCRTPMTGGVPAVSGSIPMIAPPTLEPLVAGPLLVDLAGREVTARDDASICRRESSTCSRRSPWRRGGSGRSPSSPHASGSCRTSVTPTR